MRGNMRAMLATRTARVAGVCLAAAVLLGVVIVSATGPGGGDGDGRDGDGRDGRAGAPARTVPTPTDPVTPDPPGLAATKRAIEAEERKAKETAERELNAAEDPLVQQSRVDGAARQACAGVYRAGAAWDRSDQAARRSMLTPVAADAVRSAHDPVAHSGRLLRLTLQSFGTEETMVADGMLSLAHGCGRAGLTPTGFRGDLAASWACREYRRAVPADVEAGRRLWSLAQHSVVKGLATSALALRDGLEAQRRGEEPLVPLGEARDGIAAACRGVG